MSKPYEPFGGGIDVKVDLSNNATKANLKNVAGVGTSKVAEKVDWVSLKSNVDKFDIDKSKTIPNDLSNLKGKVDKLDIDKVAHVHVDLSKLRNVVKNDVGKKDVHNGEIKNIEHETPLQFLYSKHCIISHIFHNRYKH